MITNKSMLILEDDLKTLSAILDRLSVVEDELSVSFALTILTDYTQVEKYINSNPKAEFDIILLDRDCRLGGSFHILDIEKFGVDKVISISSVPEYNEQAKKRGVTKSVTKDYSNLNPFVDEVARLIGELVI